MAFSKTSRVLTQAATKKVAKKGGGLFGTKKVRRTARAAAAHALAREPAACRRSG